MIFKQTETDIQFHVKVVPGASRTEIAGLYDDMLKVRISAAPEKGKANKELIGYLSKLLGLKKNDIEIASGATNSVKKIRIRCGERKTSIDKIRDELNDLIQV